MLSTLTTVMFVAQWNPPMKTGTYRVYVLLGCKDNLATINFVQLRVNVLLGKSVHSMLDYM